MGFYQTSDFDAIKGDSSAKPMVLLLREDSNTKLVVLMLKGGSNTILAALMPDGWIGVLY